MAVVLGMTELWKMAQAEASSPAERGWVERIQGAGKRLAATVERMLKLIRTERVRQHARPARHRLEPLLRCVVSELQPYLVAREQQVELDLAPDLGSAEVDPSKLADILMNLLINAIKFTPDGGSVRVAAGPEGPDRVRFQVTDQGIGITPADRPHLFEPFFTGFDTLHHSSGDYQFCKRGIGLGLCLVKTFVELHGGEIEVASEPTRGSTFTFSLPRHPTPVKPDHSLAG